MRISAMRDSIVGWCAAGDRYIEVELNYRVSWAFEVYMTGRQPRAIGIYYPDPGGRKKVWLRSYGSRASRAPVYDPFAILQGKDIVSIQVLRDLGRL
jgi:hypothetical protein